MRKQHKHLGMVMAVSIFVQFGPNARAATMIYTSSAEFFAAVQSGGYAEDFSAFPLGPLEQTISIGPVNGFSYDMMSDGAASGTLFSGDGIMSTLRSNDSIVVTMTGAAVTAVGANFWLTDIDFSQEIGSIVVTFWNGSAVTETIVNPTEMTFIGFTSDSPISQLTIDSIKDGETNWPTIDNIFVGQAVPLPGAFVLLGVALASLAMLRSKPA